MTLHRYAGRRQRPLTSDVSLCLMALTGRALLGGQCLGRPPNRDWTRRWPSSEFAVWRVAGIRPRMRLDRPYISTLKQRKRVSERVVGGVPGDTFGGGRLVICFRALQYAVRFIYQYTASTLRQMSSGPARADGDMIHVHTARRMATVHWAQSGPVAKAT